MTRERPPLRVIEGGGPAAVAADSGALPALELMALGTGLVLASVLMARLPSWRAELGTFQALYAVAFVFYALALLRAGRFRGAPMAPTIVLVVALAGRVALLPVAPTLSDEIYRSVWEGKVVLAGENPYRLPPLAPRLLPVRDETVFPRIEHPERAAVSPPGSLAGFALVTALSPTVWAMKLWVVLHDVAVVAILLLWLGRRGENPVLGLAYAWNPLVLAEFAGNGHLDPVGLAWLGAALAWAERRPTLSALALALGALAKLAPLAALPFLWRGWPRRARLLAMALLLPGLGAYLLIWIVSAGSGPPTPIPSWRSNDLVFHYLSGWLGELRAWAVVGVLLFWTIVWLAWRRDDPAYSTRLVLRAGLLVSPVARAWHFAWPIVLEPLGPSAAWVLLSLTCVLSYGLLAPPREGGSFDLPLAWRWVEYGIPLLLSGVLAWIAHRRGEGGRPHPRR